jgi:hypothetical protein
MKVHLRSAAAVAALIVATPTPIKAQYAPIPARATVELSKRINQEFSVVYDIRLFDTYDATETADAVVVGYASTGHKASRVVIYKISPRNITVKWDSLSDQSLQHAQAFETSGGPGVGVDSTDDGYRVFIQGCARHQCADGISGFFTYDARSGKTSEATVTTVNKGVDSIAIDHYEVKFRGSDDSSSVAYLKNLICKSGSLSEKDKLPFPCK